MRQPEEPRLLQGNIIVIFLYLHLIRSPSINLDELGWYRRVLNVLHMILGEKCVEPSSQVYCTIQPSAQSAA